MQEPGRSDANSIPYALAPSGAPELVIECDSAEATLARLGDQLERLAGRLAPILRDATPGDPSDVAMLNTQPKTHYGGRIRSLSDQVGRYSEIVDDLTARLEV